MIFEVKLNETFVSKDLKANLNAKVWVDKNPIFKIQNKVSETLRVATKIFLIDLKRENKTNKVLENAIENLL